MWWEETNVQEFRVWLVCKTPSRARATHTKASSRAGLIKTVTRKNNNSKDRDVCVGVSAFNQVFLKPAYTAN